MGPPLTIEQVTKSGVASPICGEAAPLFFFRQLANIQAAEWTAPNDLHLEPENGVGPFGPASLSAFRRKRHDYHDYQQQQHH